MALYQVVKKDDQKVLEEVQGSGDGSSNGRMPNIRVVIINSGDWTSPVTGWARITCIGGGGSGGSQSRVNGGDPCLGSTGGTTSFGTLLSAAGGAGGGGGGASKGGGGGGAGRVVTDYILLQKDTSYSLIVGAGGLVNTTPGNPETSAGGVGYQDKNAAGQGAVNAVGGSLPNLHYGSGNGTMWLGNGGNGGWNGTGYGGGGGGNCGGTGGTTTTYPGLPGRGGDNGQSAPRTNGTYINNNGGNGGNGAIIIEYYDPAKE